MRQRLHQNERRGTHLGASIAVRILFIDGQGRRLGEFLTDGPGAYDARGATSVMVRQSASTPHQWRVFDRKRLLMSKVIETKHGDWIESLIPARTPAILSHDGTSPTRSADARIGAHRVVTFVSLP
jgi:hypothetical protein